MPTLWGELTPNGKCRRFIRTIPDAAMWIGYSGYCALALDADGTTVETVFPSAFFGHHNLDCESDIAGAGCRTIESAKASAEAAVRKRLEENVAAMGGKIVWEGEEGAGR